MHTPYQNGKKIRPILAVRNEEESEDEEKSEKTEGMDPFEHKFLKTRQILLSGEINKPLRRKSSASSFSSDSDNCPHLHRLPGGDADAGYAIFDMIRFIKAVITVGMGLVASAGSIILLAPGAPFRCRTATTHSSAAFRHQESRLKSRFTPRARENARQINELIAAETGLSIEKVSRHRSDFDERPEAPPTVSFQGDNLRAELP